MVGQLRNQRKGRPYSRRLRYRARLYTGTTYIDLDSRSYRFSLDWHYLVGAALAANAQRYYPPP